MNRFSTTILKFIGWATLYIVALTFAMLIMMFAAMGVNHVLRFFELDTIKELRFIGTMPVPQVVDGKLVWPTETPTPTQIPEEK